jgi:glycosyltransferase involved in cell wall biosynthesis
MNLDKNLVIVIDAFSRGGSQKVLQLLIPEFIKKYKSVSIFLIQNSNFEMKLDDLELQGLKIFRISAKNFLDLKAFLRFLYMVNKVKPHHIQAHLYWSQIWSIFLKIIQPSVKIAWIEHNTYLDRSKIKWILFKIFSLFTVRIVAVSYEVKNYLSKRNFKRITVVFNPISPIFFSDNKIVTDASFLFVGRLNEQKNPFLTLNAFEYALNNGLIPKTSRLLICGEGSLLKNLKILVSTVKHEEFISFSGFLEETVLSKKYMESMVLVSTSLYEGFSLVRAEALASGCTIVTTDTSGVRGLLTTSAEEITPLDGIFIVNRSVESVANGLSHALNSNLWLADSIQARRNIVKKLDPKLIANKYCEIFSKS